MTGTLLNIATVLLGGGLGVFLGARLPERMRETVMHGLGLVTLIVGIDLALGTQNILIPMGSVLIGAILGEWVGASQGLGIFMLRATNSFRTDWVFVSIAITALLSIALFGLTALIERLALPWYYTAAREERWEELRTGRGE